MSDIKLFRLVKGQAAELQGDASDLEKPLIRMAYEGRGTVEAVSENRHMYAELVRMASSMEVLPR